MKKLTLLLALVSGSLASFAQNNNDIIPPAPIEESKFSLGVKGGFGHAFLIPYGNYKFMPSWDAGLSAVYSPYVHFGFGLDATYSTEGSKLQNSDYTSTIDLNYIRLAPKAIYFFRSYEMDFRPKISLAPTVGFLTNSADAKGFNKTDFGASASLGFNYRLVRAIWLSVDASYYQGLIDTYPSNGVTDLNGNARLDVGFNFGF
ncbi:hypothetical protein CNR22_19020 [Sphingobacteriaceae bacterium]|nr:hypothetical protein CNR22_19020 [Sphingobacteriaceae bacterium]